MKILITGAAGFVGSSLVKSFSSFDPTIQLFGVDNLSRRGSEFNVPFLENICENFIAGDISSSEVVDAMPSVDWVIDCAANPSVLAGVNSGTRKLLDDNLIGTINLLEKCKNDHSGFIMLSTSRVYSITELNNISLIDINSAFSIDIRSSQPIGVSEKGISETFSTATPISLYGVSKLTSELLALEYSSLYEFPIWINRCGVIAGPGQFGKIDQGIFSFWIYQYILDKPLTFTGFGGDGHQVRDMLHPSDVFSLLISQIFGNHKTSKKVFNIGGGNANAMSLKELDIFCKKNINDSKEVLSIDENRQFDIPLYISDYSVAQEIFNWSPKISSQEILESILLFAKTNPEFLRKIQ